MQLLPNYDRAIIAIEKLRDYVLNEDHPVGRSKARVFKTVLAIESRHAEAFAGIILASLSRSPAQAGVRDKYGQRWVTYNEIIGLNGRSTVVTIVWIFRPEPTDVPMLVTCYIELKEQEKLRRLLEGELNGH